MDIYIIIYKTNSYRPETLHRTYEHKNDALLQATEYASGNNFNLNKILKLNTLNNEITEFELAIVEGKLKLQEK